MREVGGRGLQEYTKHLALKNLVFTAFCAILLCVASTNVFSEQ